MRLLLHPSKKSAENGPIYIVDTCTIIALQEFEIAGKSALKFVRETLRLESTAIIGTELERRRADGILHTDEGKFWERKSKSLGRKFPAAIDWTKLKPLCSGPPPSKGSQGEASVAWHVIKRSTESFETCIFVTDDKSSRNLFFDNLCLHFPLVQVLSTLDLVRSMTLCACAGGRLLLPAALAVIRDAIVIKARNATRAAAHLNPGVIRSDTLIQELRLHQDLLKTACYLVNPPKIQ